MHFVAGDLKERNRLGDLGVGESILLKCLFQKYGMRMWLRIGCSGGLL
jgi:hypothetical protein